MKRGTWRAVIIAGGLALAAGPAWAGGGGGHAGTAGAKDPAVSPRAESQHGVDLSSENIRAMEQKLRAMGLNPGNIDGVIDSETQSAIAEFQMEKNLPVTGTLDQQTVQELAMESGSLEPATSYGPGSGSAHDISS